MRRRLTLAGLLAVVLAACLLPLPVVAQSTVDGDIGSVGNFFSPDERSSFYASGLFWVFYKEGSTTAGTLHFRSSSDRITWSAPTSIRAGIRGYPEVYFDGTYGHYVVPINGEFQVYYRRFTPNADGTLTYSAAEQATGVPCLSAFNGTTIYISVDTNGYPWVATRHPTNGKAQVAKSSTNDGTWSTDWVEFITVDIDFWPGPLLALTNGRMLATYLDDGQTIRGRRWDGVAWSAERATTTVRGSSATLSMVAQDDNVHLVNNAQGTWDIEYEFYDYSTNSWGGGITLYDATSQYQAPVITRTNLNDLYVFIEETPDVDGLYYMKYDSVSSTWGNLIKLVDESIIDGLPAVQAYLRTDYTSDSTRVGVYYVADPQKLKYKDVTEPVAVTTLEPSAVASSSATLRGEITSLGTGAPTERGFQYRLLGGDTSTVGETGTFGPGVYNLPVSDLEIDEIYEVRAYVVSGGSPSYGSWLQFLSGATGEPESPEDVEGGMVPPVPTSAPGGWITDPNDRTFDGWFGSDLINSFADTISRSFVWFLLMVFFVGALGIGLCKFTRHLGITFLILGTLLGLFIMGDYLDWFYIFPYLLVGFALIIREGQFSWN